MQQLTNSEQDEKWLERIKPPINWLGEVLVGTEDVFSYFAPLREALLDVAKVAVREDPRN